MNIQPTTNPKHVESVRMDRILSKAIRTAANDAGKNRSDYIRSILHVYLNQQKP